MTRENNMVELVKTRNKQKKRFTSREGRREACCCLELMSGVWVGISDSGSALETLLASLASLRSVTLLQELKLAGWTIGPSENQGRDARVNPGKWPRLCVMAAYENHRWFGEYHNPEITAESVSSHTHPGRWTKGRGDGRQGGLTCSKSGQMRKCVDTSWVTRLNSEGKNQIWDITLMWVQGVRVRENQVGVLVSSKHWLGRFPWLRGAWLGEDTTHRDFPFSAGRTHCFLCEGKTDAWVGGWL